MAGRLVRMNHWDILERGAPNRRVDDCNTTMLARRSGVEARGGSLRRQASISAVKFASLVRAGNSASGQAARPVFYAASLRMWPEMIS